MREESQLDDMRAAIRGDFARLAERRGAQDLLRITDVENPEPREEHDDESHRAPSWLARLFSR